MGGTAKSFRMCLGLTLLSNSLYLGTRLYLLPSGKLLPYFLKIEASD